MQKILRDLEENGKVVVAGLLFLRKDGFKIKAHYIGSLDMPDSAVMANIKATLEMV
jgi:hypothetical protein